MENDKQWEMTDNGKYQMNDGDRQWGITEQGNSRQWRITYNGNGRQYGDEGQLKL